MAPPGRVNFRLTSSGPERRTPRGQRVALQTNACVGEYAHAQRHHIYTNRCIHRKMQIASSSVPGSLRAPDIPRFQRSTTELQIKH